MTKTIVTIAQMSDGKVNPKTDLMEKPAWQLGFEDHTADILFRSKMLNCYPEVITRLWKTSGVAM